VGWRLIVELLLTYAKQPFEGSSCISSSWGSIGGWEAINSKWELCANSKEVFVFKLESVCSFLNSDPEVFDSLIINLLGNRCQWRIDHDEQVRITGTGGLFQ
jgi:hypothetical protein